MKPKNAGQSKFLSLIQGTVISTLLLTEITTRKFRILGEIADYRLWLFSEFGKVRISHRREGVWLKMNKALNSNNFAGVELGVAWGYLTWWWVTNFSTGLISWAGFDRFTGLPRGWRNLPAGTFDANGTPPDIQDSRIKWFIGDVEKTIKQMKIDSGRSYPLIVFFDLDIYEPSLVAWNYLKNQLRLGDLLYFDEAFDQDERKLLTEVILPSGKFQFIGASHLSLALRVLEIN
jgi:hypothetical protein